MEIKYRNPQRKTNPTSRRKERTDTSNGNISETLDYRSKGERIRIAVEGEISDQMGNQSERVDCTGEGVCFRRESESRSHYGGDGN